MPVDRELALRTAERLLRQGRLEGAIAEYVRLTDDQPRDWNSINTLGDLYVRAGDSERAVAQFVRIADHLFDEGFLPKAAALYKKALKVKHDHEHTLFRLAEIAARQGLFADGKLYLRQLIQQRQSRGDRQGAAACVVRLGEIDEDDGDAKIVASRAAKELNNVPKAIALLLEAAAAFEKQKRPSDAVDALIAAAELAPDDQALRATVARTLLAAGQVERAQPFLGGTTGVDDPDLLIAMARRDLTTGRSVEGVASLMRAVALAPDRQDQVETLADDLFGAGRAEDAYGCVDVLVDAALFEARFDRAAALLESFLERRRLIPGLLKLVDVYVDAGRDDRITSVQEELADAYLEDGQPAAARVVAEDLIAREPQVDAHVQRLRRALVALGVEDVDATVARQIEEASTLADLLELTPLEEPQSSSTAPSSVDVSVGSDEIALVELEVEPVSVPSAAPDEPLVDPGPTARDGGEIDLSGMLADIKVASAVHPPVPSAASQGGSDGAVDPAALFEQAQAHLRRGQEAEAVAALRAVARSPQWRFRASAQIGRLSVARGDFQQGVEWLEHAASAAAPSPTESYAVIYDLADALERLGEAVRALALFMELQADAGTFRDVSQRIDDLARGATGVNGDRR